MRLVVVGFVSVDGVIHTLLNSGENPDGRSSHFLPGRRSYEIFDGYPPSVTKTVSAAKPERSDRVADERGPLTALLRALVRERPEAEGEATSSLRRQHASKIVRSFAPSGLVYDQPRPAARVIEALTNRELEVLRLIAVDRKDREIAQDLFVTPDTVKKHISHILSKLTATNRTHAVARARDLRLIP